MTATSPKPTAAAAFPGVTVSALGGGLLAPAAQSGDHEISSLAELPALVMA